MNIRNSFITFLTASFILANITASFAQAELEAGVIVGSASYLGEIGGASEKAKPFFLDVDLKETKPGFGFFYKYQTDPLWAIRSQFMYGQISGDDKQSGSETRRARNLSFRNTIYEVSSVVQLELFETISRVRGTTARRSVGGISSGSPIHVLAYMGLGLFYHNPQAQLDGTWYDLQPLGTEGQGLDGQRNKYSRLQIAMPFGLEVFMPVNPKVRIGLDIGARKTFTDYLDDVSGVYYDKAEIEAAYGSEAALLSNRTGEITGNGDDWEYSGAGAIRGNPTGKDYYFYTSLSIGYKFQTSKYYKPKFNRTSSSIANRLKQNRSRHKKFSSYRKKRR